MKRTTTSLCGLAIAAALLVGACGSDDDSESDPTAPPTDPSTAQEGDGPQLLKSEIGYAEPSPDAPVDAVVTGSNDAGFELQRHLDAQGENLVFSPASLSTAFAMASAGAGDEATAAALRDVFGFPEGDATHEAMNALIADLVPDNSSGDEELASELSVANSGWALVGEDIGQEFLDTLAKYYDAGLYTTDFGGDPEGSSKAINAWVDEATHGRITELVKPEDFTPDTLYTLVNALYFNARWSSDFDPESSGPEPFTLADGTRKDVEMMFDGERHAPYLTAGGTTLVKLPYGDGEFEMTIAMPRNLAKFVETLDAATWEQLTGAATEGLVDLTLPKWETATATSFDDALNAMGIEIPGGDFTKVADDMRIGKVLQAANITVDELGTEAAAATAIIGEAGAAPMEEEPVEITIDKPFFYTIEHAPTGTILFAGQVNDPSAG